MKIKCPACSAAYRIPDARVRGKNKVFRVGCKKCGAEIRVRGIATDEDQGRATMPFNLALPDSTPATPQRVWFAGIDGKQVGPLTEQEVLDHISAGRLGRDDLVWRKGFGAWTPAREVPAFQEAVTGKAAQPAVKPAGRKRSPRRAQTLELSAQMIELLVKLDEQSAAAGGATAPEPPSLPESSIEVQTEDEVAAEEAADAAHAKQEPPETVIVDVRKVEADQEAADVKQADEPPAIAAAAEAEEPPAIAAEPGPVETKTEKAPAAEAAAAQPAVESSKSKRRSRRGKRRRGKADAAPEPAKVVAAAGTKAAAKKKDAGKPATKVSLPGKAEAQRRASSHKTAAAGKLASVGSGTDRKTAKTKASGTKKVGPAAKRGASGAAKASAAKATAAKAAGKKAAAKKGAAKKDEKKDEGGGVAVFLGIGIAVLVIGAVVFATRNKGKPNKPAEQAAPAAVAAAETPAPTAAPEPPPPQPPPPPPPPPPAVDAGPAVPEASQDAGAAAVDAGMPGEEGKPASAAVAALAAEQAADEKEKAAAEAAKSDSPESGGTKSDKSDDRKERKRKRRERSDDGGGPTTARSAPAPKPVERPTAEKGGMDEIDRLLAEQRKKAAAKKAKPKPAPKPKPAAKGGMDDIDRILAEQRRKKEAEKAKAKAPSSSGSKRGKLSQADVSRIAGKARGSVMKCYMLHADVDGSSETIKVKIRVQGNGSVQQARVLGKYGKNEVGKCIGNAVKKLTFPHTGGATASHTVRYSVGG